MKASRNVLGLALVLVAACGAAGRGASPGLTDDEAVLEAVLLHEIAAAHPTAEDGLCLRVRTYPSSGHDPSAALITAIQRRYPAAGVASSCSGGGPQPVTVADSGEPALMFDVGPVVRGPDDLRVNGGGHHRGGSSGIREVEYRIVRKGGQLVVVSERVMMQN